MKQTISLLVIALLAFYSVVYSQNIHKSDSISTFEKARYLNGDLTNALLNNGLLTHESKVKFASDALYSQPVGDVIFSFIITKEGKLENIIMISPMIARLSTKVLKAINQLTNNWSPTKDKGIPVDKRYSIVFRFRPTRTFEEFKAADFEMEALEYEKNKKYDKALRSYNKAIKDNPFEWHLFEARAKVKVILGDIAGSKQDHNTSLDLNKDIMIVLNLYTS